MSIVFIGMETSGELRRRYQAAGYETYSCDLLPSQDGGEEIAYSDDGLPLGRHLVGDVFETLDHLWANDLWPELAIFHPDCTYLTNSAEWAYADSDFDRYPGVGYHQKVKPETLVGAARREARERALADVRRIFALPIRKKVIENPIGVIGSRIRKASQIVQPFEFGDDASKATCLWFLDKDGSSIMTKLPIDPAKRVAGRIVDGAERWSNQTDKGQNRLSPGADRWQKRSNTYAGIADAIVASFHP